jgi:hypothetical protein
MVPVPDLAKHFFFSGPVLAPVPTSLCQLRGPGYKNLTLNRRFLPVQTEYPDNTGANDLLVGSTVVLTENNFKKLG